MYIHYHYSICMFIICVLCHNYKYAYLRPFVPLSVCMYFLYACSIVHPQVFVMYSYMCFCALCISTPVCICTHTHCYTHAQTQICETYLYREEGTRGINSTEATDFPIIPYRVHLEITHTLHNLKNKLQ